MLLRLGADAGINFTEYDCRRQPLQILVEIEVYSCAIIYIGDAPVPFQPLRGINIAEVLASESPKPSAILASGTVDICLRRVHEVVAIIQSCIIRAN